MIDYDLLSTLAANQPQTYQQLSAQLDLSILTVGQHVREVVSHGWATTTRPAHTRCLHVTVTPDGLAALKEQSTRPTVGAVIAVARKLCDRAAQEISADPYAKPYAPSDNVARTLSERNGPETAIEILYQRAARARHEEREANVIAERAQARHERRQRHYQRDRQAALAGLSPGQRLDRLHADVSILQTAPASRLDTDVVRDGGGGKDDANPVPRLYDDLAADLRRESMRLIHKFEERVDRERRRPCAFERAS